MGHKRRTMRELTPAMSKVLWGVAFGMVTLKFHPAGFGHWQAFLAGKNVTGQFRGLQRRGLVDFDAAGKVWVR